MASLIPWPWRKKTTEPGGNGGALTTPARDFPTLMHRLQREFDDLFERMAREWPVFAGDFESRWRWGMDFEDKDDAYVVRAEAPGFEPNDFDISVSGDRLILRASHKSEEKGKERAFREQVECYECVTLPPGVDKDKIEAKYHNGILTLTLPKTKEGRGRKIAVKNA